jgi:hypothetical protein
MRDAAEGKRSGSGSGSGAHVREAAETDGREEVDGEARVLWVVAREQAREVRRHRIVVETLFELRQSHQFRQLLHTRHANGRHANEGDGSVKSRGSSRQQRQAGSYSEQDFDEDTTRTGGIFFGQTNVSHTRPIDLRSTAHDRWGQASVMSGRNKKGGGEGTTYRIGVQEMAKELCDIAQATGFIAVDCGVLQRKALVELLLIHRIQCTKAVAHHTNHHTTAQQTTHTHRVRRMYPAPSTCEWVGWGVVTVRPKGRRSGGTCALDSNTRAAYCTAPPPAPPSV